MSLDGGPKKERHALHGRIIAPNPSFNFLKIAGKMKEQFYIAFGSL